MKKSFVIKSFQNGISLILDPAVSYEELIQDIAAKFKESRAFFGSANIALSFEGRELTQSQEFEILDVINENSDLDVICIVEKADDENINFIKALQTLQNKLPSGDYAKFYKGSVQNNDVIEMEDSIIVMGDVNPGCVVSSNKNIIVLGSLLGEAYAGRDSEEESYIIALEMLPESLGIGNFKYRPTKKTGWKRSKVQPKIALVYNDEVTILPLTKDILETL